LRQRRHRQLAKRDDAGEKNRRHQQRRRDRTKDEDARWVHDVVLCGAPFLGGAPAPPPAFFARPPCPPAPRPPAPAPPRPPPTSTLPCGCSLSVPSVTTCSPSRTPVTTEINPSFNTICTGRISAVLSAPTT